MIIVRLLALYYSTVRPFLSSFFSNVLFHLGTQKQNSHNMKKNQTVTHHLVCD